MVIDLRLQPGYSDAECCQSVCPNKVIAGSAAELDSIRRGLRPLQKDVSHSVLPLGITPYSIVPLLQLD